jgi:hypothetical protein
MVGAFYWRAKTPQKRRTLSLSKRGQDSKKDADPSWLAAQSTAFELSPNQVLYRARTPGIELVPARHACSNAEPDTARGELSPIQVNGEARRGRRGDGSSVAGRRGDGEAR